MLYTGYKQTWIIPAVDLSVLQNACLVRKPGTNINAAKKGRRRKARLRKEILKVFSGFLTKDLHTLAAGCANQSSSIFFSIWCYTLCLRTLSLMVQNNFILRNSRWMSCLLCYSLSSNCSSLILCRLLLVVLPAWCIYHCYRKSFQLITFKEQNESEKIIFPILPAVP